MEGRRRPTRIHGASSVARPRNPRSQLPPYVHAVTARGRAYYYFHRHRGTGRDAGRIALPGEPFDSDGLPVAAWWSRYRELAVGEPVEAEIAPGSFAALIKAYCDSPEWRSLSARSREGRARDLKRIEAMWGRLPVTGLESRHVLELRDRFSTTPGAANNLVRSVSAMISWSLPRGWREHNPCVQIKKLKIGPGYAPWTWDQIELFRRHARPEMWHAAALALYSGQRLGDVLEMRWDEIDGQLIGVSVVQNKTAKTLWVAMHRDLKTLLAAIPRRAPEILTSSRGGAWTNDGFKASWADQMKRPEFAPLKEAGCVFHGLRKSAVVFLLEAGCTDAEVAAITGQSRDMVEHYARAVNQKRLAAAAILKWEAARHGRGDSA